MPNASTEPATPDSVDDRVTRGDEVVIPGGGLMPDAAAGETGCVSEPGATRPGEFRTDRLSFWLLIAVQFFTGLNDNLFRWLVVPLARTGGMDSSTALAVGGLCFLLPYLMLAPLAGSLSDKYPKRSVTLACKVAEVGILLFGLGMIWLTWMPGIFFAVALMGAQSAIFAPAKYASIPEYLPPSQLSYGNGMMGVITVAATALGLSGGYWLAGASGLTLETRPDFGAIAIVGCCFLGVSALGLAATVYMREVPAPDPDRAVVWNPATETRPALHLIGSDLVLMRTALGIAFFWSLGTLAQLAVDIYAHELLQLSEQSTGILMTTLIIGVGLGSLLAGLLCGEEIELGLVPLGALGIALGAFVVFFAGNIAEHASHPSHWTLFACVGLGMLGLSSGLFDIPLEAYLQHRAPNHVRGTILAGANFITFTGMAVTCVLFWVMTNEAVLGWSADAVFLVAGVGTLPVAVYAFTLLPKATTRLVAWLLRHSLYSVRVEGERHIPDRGGALLVSNHSSWADGPLISAVVRRTVQFVIWRENISNLKLDGLARQMGLIPIHSPQEPKKLRRGLNRAERAINRGEVVCVFPEGEVSRTGTLGPFQSGLAGVIERVAADRPDRPARPIVPVYVAGMWGSVFSFRGGRFFWKLPRRMPYPVTIHFGRPLAADQSDAAAVRRSIESLGSDAMSEHFKRDAMFLPRFVRQCKAARFRSQVADSSGKDLSGGRFLAGCLALRTLMQSQPWAADERIGVLLPPSVGGAIANVSLALLGRVSINLNYTMDEQTLNVCLDKGQVKTVLTSRAFIEKRPLTLDADYIYLEDLFEQIGDWDKRRAAIDAFVTPSWWLCRKLGLHRRSPDELVTIIFTSGSTGQPKGVMLSYTNVYSQVAAVDQLFRLDRTDVELGVLPFFHSFGYSETLWLPLCSPPKVVYHFNPLDSRTIGELAEAHGVTFLFATPTFLRAYQRRVTPEQFAKLDLVVVGAEKLPAEVAANFRQTFGVDPTEGYGATELSPFTAVNVPDHRATGGRIGSTRAGTVGRVMPGSAAKCVDPDTWADRPTGEEGLLVIKGPNVMVGYLNDEAKTAEVIRDGWYSTGDLAIIDEDGFITITGRRSRFSKIGGEMVPHIRVEQELERLCDAAGDPHESQVLAVSAVPDAKKGERLVVLHQELPLPIDTLLDQLAETGLPKLWLPSSRDFYAVDEIPMLGSGKLDLKRLGELAKEKTGAEAAVG